VTANIKMLLPFPCTTIGIYIDKCGFFYCLASIVAKHPLLLVMPCKGLLYMPCPHTELTEDEGM